MDKPTDERFVYYYPSQIIKDKQTGERHYGNKALADLLNELHEEVQAQSIVIKGYQERNDKLFKENEQLKKQLNAFKPIIFEDANNGSSSVLYEKVEE